MSFKWIYIFMFYNYYCLISGIMKASTIKITEKSDMLDVH